MGLSWRDLLGELVPVFARRSTFRLVVALACGMILADRSTVVAMAAAGGAAGQWRRACWFFSGAAWDIDALGLFTPRSKQPGRLDLRQNRRLTRKHELASGSFFDVLVLR